MLKNRRARMRTGFTVVELIIVIAVIAILAIITIVGYRGFSERTRNASRINMVRQLEKTIHIARANHSPTQIVNALNTSDGWSRACIGAGYPDVNNDGKRDCGAYLGDPYVSESAAFNTILGKMASIPSMSGYPVLKASDGDVQYGPFVATAWVDGKNMLVLEYYLEGQDQDCVVRPLVYYTATDDNTMTPTGNPKYSVSANKMTECMAAIGNGF